MRLFKEILMQQNWMDSLSSGLRHGIKTKLVASIDINDSNVRINKTLFHSTCYVCTGLGC